MTREVLWLRNTSTPEQLEALRPRLKLCQRICLDYTGPGVGLGDFVNREFGAHRVELCTFTSSLKAELFPRLAAAFESRQLLIPIGRDIREDLHSIYCTVTNSGQILYRAHGGPCGSLADGHADRTTALALSLRAAQSAPRPCLRLQRRSWLRHVPRHRPQWKPTKLLRPTPTHPRHHLLMSGLTLNLPRNLNLLQLCAQTLPPIAIPIRTLGPACLLNPPSLTRRPRNVR